MPKQPALPSPLALVHSHSHSRLTSSLPKPPTAGLPPPKTPPPTTTMAAGEHALVEESTVPVVSDVADAAAKPYVRPALFLRPRAGDGAPAPAPPGDPGPVLPRGIEAEFMGWAGVPRLWPEWVAKLRRRHEPLWREVGILGGILASTCRVRHHHHERVLLQLAAFWYGATSTFVFPWGEVTLTLEDVATLAGLPLLGDPVRAPVSDSLEKDVAAIEAVRAVMNRSKKKKSSYGAWVKRFVERTPEEEMPPPATGDGGRDGEAHQLVEHGAFLSMWLSLFVLPGPPFDVVRREIIPLAARLARGESVALAPAALATIYHDLSALKRHITSGDKNGPFVISAPIHILQLWVWEHFTQLRPETVGSSTPDDHDMPRAARWREAGKRLSSKDLHAVLMSPKGFEWRPYKNSRFFGLHPGTGGSWVRGQDIATSEALLSFARCLHPCELVGMNCIEQYNPHRVARQLGFDQDIPGTVPRASSGWEKAWETYNIEAKSSAFIFPNHKPGVTVQYAKWWKPYSSACGSAVANAAKIKEGHDLVSPVKRKMEGVLAGNSGKKVRLRVATATLGCPPNIPAGINVYPSQSSGSHAATRRAAAAPGLVLRACPPHLRFKAVSPTGMPQPLRDAAYDPLDHVSLSERLDGITKMPKQHNTECLVKDSEQERIVKRVKIVTPKPPSAGPEKAVLHKVVEQALPDAVASSAIIHDSSSVFGTERPHARCLQQSKDEDLNSANGENISRRTEHCDVVLLNVVQGAVSTVKSEAIGAGTEVDMLPTHEDLLVVSDGDRCDKSSSMGHEVHLESHMSGAKMSFIRERNEGTELVDARNDEEDSQVLKEATKQGNFGDTVKFNDDELDKLTRKEARVFVEAMSNKDAPSAMHLKCPEMEPTRTILQECNEEKQMVRETNDEHDNPVMKEGTVQNSYDRQLASVLDGTTPRQQPDVLTHAATVQTYDGLLKEPAKEMDTCIVTGDIDNTDKVLNEKFGSLNFSEKGNEDTFVSNQGLEYPMEHSAGASRKKSGTRIC